MSDQNDFISTASFDEICRACLSCEEGFRISEIVYEGVSLKEIFESIINLQIKPNDDLPQNLCKSCMTQLAQIHIFKQQCQESETLLRAALNRDNHTKKADRIEVKNSDEQQDESLGKETQIFDPGELKRSEPECRLDNAAEAILEEHQYALLTTDLISDIKLEPAEISDHENLEEIVQNEYNLSSSNILPTQSSTEHVLHWKCKLCENAFSTFGELKEHKKEAKHFYPRNHKCTKCNKAFCSSRSLQRHVKNHENSDMKKVLRVLKLKEKPVKSYACIHCKMSFNSFPEMKIHLKEAGHPRRVLHPCSLCQKSFTSYRLKLHMRTHTKEKPYCCKYCKMQFSLRNNWSRHIKIHTGERRHVCEFCGKGFIQGPSLVAHRRIHTGETPFKCNQCGKCFGQRANYLNHLQRHVLESEKLLDTESSLNNSRKTRINKGNKLCDKCGKNFMTMQMLKTHLLLHGEKKFLCNHCGKRFTAASGLITHTRVVHQKAKPYTCDVCNKKFSMIGSLKAHMRIHTGERPYVCKTCSKTFSQQPHLTYHMRTHSGEKPYSCTYCGKSFSLKGTLTVHLRIHTGETPFVCEICNKGFYHSNNMKKHRKVHDKLNNKIKEVKEEEEEEPSS